MISTLYRYPHPYDSTKFIYVGQGSKRDAYHRSGKGSFGRRFKKMFPDDVLPEPIKEQIDVSGQLELNEEEIIWMFRYHTWRGYPDGMNLLLPGSQDYKNMGKIGGKLSGGSAAGKARMSLLGKTGIGGRIGGKIIGNILALIPGKMSSMGKKGGKIGGKNGNQEDRSRAGKIGGKIGGRGSVGHKTTNCLRWNIRRGKPCACGKHLNENT
jgi:hypothetical protein